MKNNKGLTLIELLVVIAILGVLMMISFPFVNRLLTKNEQQKYINYKNLLRETSKEYMDELGIVVSGCYEIKQDDKTAYDILKEEGLISGFDECSDSETAVYTNNKGKVTDVKVNLKCGSGYKESNEFDTNKCTYNVIQYKDSYGGNIDPNVNAPELYDNMIPVKYNGEYWVIADENNSKYSEDFISDYKWYLYEDGYFANAVILKQGKYSNYKRGNVYRVGKKIEESDVKDWWVWIPRFEYNGFNINYVKKTNSATSGYTIPEGFKTTKQLGKKELKGFWINKNYKENSENKTREEVFEDALNVNIKLNSHIINKRELDTARKLYELANKTEESRSETSINDLGISHETGSVYSSTEGKKNLHNVYLENTKYTSGDVDGSCSVSKAGLLWNNGLNFTCASFTSKYFNYKDTIECKEYCNRYTDLDKSICSGNCNPTTKDGYRLIDLLFNLKFSYTEEDLNIDTYEKYFDTYNKNTYDNYLIFTKSVKENNSTNTYDVNICEGKYNDDNNKCYEYKVTINVNTSSINNFLKNYWNSGSVITKQEFDENILNTEVTGVSLGEVKYLPSTSKGSRTVMYYRGAL